jgi:hypothetical protein
MKKIETPPSKNKTPKVANIFTSIIHFKSTPPLFLPLLYDLKHFPAQAGTPERGYFHIKGQKTGGMCF